MYDKLMSSNDIENINHDLLKMRGETITRVAMDQWSVHLIFDNCTFMIESMWSYTDMHGVTLDEGIEIERRSRFELWKLVGKTVDKVEIVEDPLGNIILKTQDGYSITAYGDTDDFEDWHLTGNGLSIMCMGHMQMI